MSLVGAGEAFGVPLGVLLGVLRTLPFGGGGRIPSGEPFGVPLGVLLGVLFGVRRGGRRGAFGTAGRRSRGSDGAVLISSEDGRRELPAEAAIDGGSGTDGRRDTPRDSAVSIGSTRFVQSATGELGNSGSSEGPSPQGAIGPPSTFNRGLDPVVSSSSAIVADVDSSFGFGGSPARAARAAAASLACRSYIAKPDHFDQPLRQVRRQ